MVVLISVTIAAPLCKLFSESQSHKSSDISQSRSQAKPFSRTGGTILLPVPPLPGPSHQASSSSLGLPLSRGYSQMYEGRLSGKTVDICLTDYNSILLRIVFFFNHYFKQTNDPASCVSSKPTSPGLLWWKDDWGPAAGSEECHLWGHRPPPQIPWILPQYWGWGSGPQGY